MASLHASLKWLLMSRLVNMRKPAACTTLLPSTHAPMPFTAQIGMATARRVVMANRAVMVAHSQQPAATTWPRGMKWPGGGQGAGKAG